MAYVDTANTREQRDQKGVGKQNKGKKGEGGGRYRRKKAKPAYRQTTPNGSIELFMTMKTNIAYEDKVSEPRKKKD